MISKARADLEVKARQLQAAEDPQAGLFFAEQIHAARQERAMLSTQLEYRQLRLNRLRGTA